MKIRKNLKRNGRGGFSLAELMVVIVIIGLHATMVVPKVMDRFRSSQRGIAKAEMGSIKTALDQYAVDNAARYPDTLEVLVTPNEDGYTYLSKTPIDPWGNDYQYLPPDQAGQMEPILFSFGADGAPGGEADNRDIYLVDPDQ